MELELKKINSAFDSEFDRIKVGRLSEFFYELEDGDEKKFANLTGDLNPIHVNERCARRTQFKGRIAHGMLVASLFPRLFRMCVSDERPFICLSLTIDFIKPIRINSRLLIKGVVSKKIDALKVLLFEISVLNEKGETLIESQAKVRVLDTR